MQRRVVIVRLRIDVCFIFEDQRCRLDRTCVSGAVQRVLVPEIARIHNRRLLPKEQLPGNFKGHMLSQGTYVMRESCSTVFGRDHGNIIK
jgi:hypothetical protein